MLGSYEYSLSVYSIGDGDWSDGSNWDNKSGLGSDSDVIVENATLQVGAACQCVSVRITAGGFVEIGTGGVLTLS